jgi:hypothetical protein
VYQLPAIAHPERSSITSSMQQLCLRVSPEANREWEAMPKKTLNSVHFHGPAKNIPSHSLRCVDHGPRSEITACLKKEKRLYKLRKRWSRYRSLNNPRIGVGPRIHIVCKGA